MLKGKMNQISVIPISSAAMAGVNEFIVPSTKKYTLYPIPLPVTGVTSATKLVIGDHTLAPKKA